MIHIVIKCRSRPITKTPSLVQIDPMVSKTQPFENVKNYKEILTFLNRCIPVKTSLINTKPGDFVNLGVLFLSDYVDR